MTEEYFDIRCGEDLDPFGRDAAPLETFGQDLFHMLVTDPQTLIRDETFGFGLESYIGKPLPTSLAYQIESYVRRDDRADDARCVITKDPAEEDTYRLDLRVSCDAGFVELALGLTPSGIVRIS